MHALVSSLSLSLVWRGRWLGEAQTPNASTKELRTRQRIHKRSALQTSSSYRLASSSVSDSGSMWPSGGAGSAAAALEPAAPIVMDGATMAHASRPIGIGRQSFPVPRAQWRYAARRKKMKRPRARSYEQIEIEISKDSHRCAERLSYVECHSIPQDLAVATTVRHRRPQVLLLCRSTPEHRSHRISARNTEMPRLGAARVRGGTGAHTAQSLCRSTHRVYHSQTHTRIVKE